MMSKRSLKNLLTPSAFRIGVFLTLISLVIFVIGNPLFDTMDKKMYDLRFRLRGVHPAGNEVVIVAIDEKSQDDLGRWPWPRTRMAQVIERLTAARAKVIALDITFSEPDDSSGLSVMRSLRSQVSDAALGAALEKAALKADNDTKFANMLSRSPNVLLGYFFFMSSQEVQHRKGQGSETGDHHRISRFSSVRYGDKNIKAPALPEAFEVEQNIPQLGKAARHFGYFNIKPDDDGTVRWVPLAIRHRETIYPHLSLEAVRMYLGSPPLIMNAEEYGVDSIQIGDIRLPTDEQARLLINYRGPERSFPHYSFVDVLKNTVPADAFKDKIVLIGATGIGIYDMRVTPFSGVFPGVEIHANIIDNILRGDPISRPDWLTAIDVLAILLMGIGLTAIISRVRPVLSTLIAVAFVLVFAAFNQLVFVQGKTLLTDVYPVFAAILVSTGVTTFRFMTEERKKKEIKEAFSHYVAPSLVNTIVQDPGKLVLGGEERRLTVLFSDIRGFTTISESLQPQVLVKLMNDYLTPMTDIVLEHGGTIDKYMGDAIMAFWGAPIWQEDHPVRACNAALDMLTKLAMLQQEWEERGIPRLDIGVGLSTGNLTVGNMGSTTRFDYTVMGDSVNLGSRLEGLNKEYGTRIIVPKYTYEDVKHDFILRQLDKIKVKGKKIPIKIYELMGRKDAGDRLREAAGLFEAGLAAYFTRDWEKADSYFMKTMAILPNDGPSRTFLERIKNLRTLNLPEEWDGVYVMTKK